MSTDFKEIERNAQEQEKMREHQSHMEIVNREETEKQMEKQMFVQMASLQWSPRIIF